jgi:antitoxin MazE
MRAKVQKWGNSLALRLPKALADEAEVQFDSPVEISVRDHVIVIKSLRRTTSYTLDGLLSGITEENRHGEVATSAPIGQEIW